MSRNSWAALISIVLILTIGNAMNSQPQPAKQGQKFTYLVIYKPGSGWIANKPMKEQPLKEHGRYMLSLYSNGHLKFAGPFSDDAGGAVAFEAADEQEANAIVMADPAVISHVFVAEMHPWALVDWQKYLKK